MKVTDHAVFRRFWYPVMPLTKLVDGPQAFVLLQQPLALWLNEAGDPQAVEDRCCHRTAKLSLGQVQGDAIQCPYHGWQFDGSGTCVKVPQLESGPIPKSYRVKSFACQARYGYVWVCLESPPLQPIPDIPEARDPGFRQIHEFDEVWKASGLRIMENSFDNAHFSYVHAGTLGSIDSPTPASVEVFDHPEGLRVETLIPVLNPPEQQRNLGLSDPVTLRQTERFWHQPFFYRVRITYPNGLVHVMVTTTTPIDERHSQFIQFVYRSDREEDAPATGIIAFDRRVTLEDQQVLELTDPDAPLSIDGEEHMVSDKTSIMMRRKLAALIKSDA
ncbi:MAG: aromatic ring-hydroxylating dioxygenase subunit alpha [Synechococcaceae cyanobacterium SM2_3_2]|nr:aromatic ring-hydroxylating dioxygenase subunit alpha [Synechococcaceae cyanobacterium SM2_3_2]